MLSDMTGQYGARGISAAVDFCLLHSILAGFAREAKTTSHAQLFSTRPHTMECSVAVWHLTLRMRTLQRLHPPL